MRFVTWWPRPQLEVTVSETTEVVKGGVEVVVRLATQQRPCTVATGSDGLVDDDPLPLYCLPQWPRKPLRDGNNCCNKCCTQRLQPRPQRYHRMKCRSWPLPLPPPPTPPPPPLMLPPVTPPMP